MSEDEILSMSNAIVEAYKIDGAKLYATKYKEAGIQDAAVPTYRPNDSVTALITDSNGNVSNPNIVSSAVEELKKRYTTSATNAGFVFSCAFKVFSAKGVGQAYKSCKIAKRL